MPSSPSLVAERPVPNFSRPLHNKSSVAAHFGGADRMVVREG